VPVPFYFNHEMAIQMAGCTAVRVPTDDRYQLDLDAIRRAITPRTRAVITVTPNNPTGAVYPESALRDVNRICGERGLYHISDEVYEYFTYGSARHVSPGCFAGAERHTISLYSLSKAYGFAGWRIGYMVYPDALADAIAKVQDTVLVCPPMISQIAAVAAMDVGPAYCRTYLHALAEDARGGVSDPRASRGGRSRPRVRRDGWLLLPRRVRRAAKRNRRGRHRTPGHWVATHS
jgi:aspartate/methionine/tyrosine aminotransferase